MILPPPHDRLVPSSCGCAGRLCRPGRDDLQEGLQHVRGLAGLVLAPLPVEAQHRDAPLVLHLRVELGVAVLVRDHLAAAVEADVEP